MDFRIIKGIQGEVSMRKILCIISIIFAVFMLLIPLYCSDRNYYRDLSNGDTADISYGNRAYKKIYKFVMVRGIFSR